MWRDCNIIISPEGWEGRVAQKFNLAFSCSGAQALIIDDEIIFVEVNGFCNLEDTGLKTLLGIIYDAVIVFILMAIVRDGAIIDYEFVL